MARLSNKSIAKILTTANVSSQDKNGNGNDNDNIHLALLERKIILATEGFTRSKFCELVLKDGNRLSRENALTICDYILAMRREINPRVSYKKNNIQFLSEKITYNNLSAINCCY
jgi:hypothetical protein